LPPPDPATNVFITQVDANQINVLSEFIGGYMFQGKPVANMLFKILSTDVVGQGLYFVQDSKGSLLRQFAFQ